MARTRPEPNEHDWAQARNLVEGAEFLPNNTARAIAQMIATIRWQDSLLQEPLLQSTASEESPEEADIAEFHAREHDDPTVTEEDE